MSETEVIVTRGHRYTHRAFYREPVVIVFDRAKPLSARHWFVRSYAARCVRVWWRRVMGELTEGV